MNDRQRAFEALVEALSAHFQETKQVRVQKLRLLRLLYSRIDSGCSSFVAFVECYQQEFGAGNRDALLRAMRRSIKTLSTWMKEHYRRFPHHTIQFEIVDCCKLRAVIRDEFHGRSIQELVEDIGGLLLQLHGLTSQARAQFDGTSKDAEVGGLTQTVESIGSQAAALNKLHMALRSRI